MILQLLCQWYVKVISNIYLWRNIWMINTHLIRAAVCIQTVVFAFYRFNQIRRLQVFESGKGKKKNGPLLYVIPCYM